MRDYYADLQVAPHAEDGVITAAYRFLARAYHPDVAGVAAVRRMQTLNAAYEVLSDPSRRRQYDRERLTSARFEWSQAESTSATLVRAQRPRYLGAIAYTLVTAVCLMAATLLWVAARPSLEKSVFASRVGRAATPPVAPAVSPRPRGASTPLASNGLRRLQTSSPEPDLRQKTDTELERTAANPAVIEPVLSTDLAHVDQLAPPPPPEARVEVLTEAVPVPQVQTSAETVPAPAPMPPPPAPTPAYARHVVQPGENLLRIAERYGVSQIVIMQANGLTDPNSLPAGDVLLVPLR
jgi:curved DNA-binding protein CbpA